MLKCGRAASESFSSSGKRTLLFRSLSTTPIIRVDATLNASISISRSGVASYSRRHGPVLPVKSRGLLLQCRQASSDASTSGGGLKHTALYELHVSNGGKMVPFGGYSMPVQYSDLGVGESHKWTREKASLFDVGHMYDAILSHAAPCSILTLTLLALGYNTVFPAQARRHYSKRSHPHPQLPSRPTIRPFLASYTQLLEV